MENKLKQFNQQCQRVKSENILIESQGGMKGLAFIKDPDGYLIEILPQGEMTTRPVDCLGNKVNEGGYKDNSS